MEEEMAAADSGSGVSGLWRHADGEVTSDDTGLPGKRRPRCLASPLYWPTKKMHYALVLPIPRDALLQSFELTGSGWESEAVQ